MRSLKSAQKSTLTSTFGSSEPICPHDKTNKKIRERQTAPNIYKSYHFIYCIADTPWVG